MAIIFSTEEEFKDIDEVLIVVGPKLDVKVRLEVDDEGELIREVLWRNTFHMYKVDMEEKGMYCASPYQLKRGTRNSSWIQEAVVI